MGAQCRADREDFAWVPGGSYPTDKGRSGGASVANSAAGGREAGDARTAAVGLIVG